MDDQTFTFSWEVKNFSLLTTERGHQITSYFFHMGTLPDTACIAYFFPRDREDPDFVSFGVDLLSRVDLLPVCIEVRATFQLVAVDGTPGNKVHLTKNVSKFGSFGIKKFASRREVVERYLHNDTLKIQCVFKKKELTINKLFSRTEDDVRNIYQKWHLKDFSQTRKGKVLEESIRLEKRSELLFDVCLSVKGKPGREVVIIEFIRRCDTPGKRLSLNALITVLDAEGTESEIWKRDQHFFHMQTPQEMWRFPTFITKAPLLRQKNKYLPNDVLALKCEIAVSSFKMKPLEEIFPTYHYVEVGNTLSFDQLVEDMTDLYNSKRFTDVKLRVLGETVLAHKFVLRSRSKKFAEMLEEVVGTDIHVLDVTDMDVITLKRMLKYMYTDEIDDLKYDDAVVAYITAYKYRIESLKCKYSFVLQSRLSVRNACIIL